MCFFCCKFDYAILGYFTTYYLSGIWHNWSVQLNNVHMKERQISKKKEKKNRGKRKLFC